MTPEKALAILEGKISRRSEPSGEKDKSEVKAPVSTPNPKGEQKATSPVAAQDVKVINTIPLEPQPVVEELPQEPKTLVPTAITSQELPKRQSSVGLVIMAAVLLNIVLLVVVGGKLKDDAFNRGVNSVQTNPTLVALSNEVASLKDSLAKIQHDKEQATQLLNNMQQSMDMMKSELKQAYDKRVSLVSAEYQSKIEELKNQLKVYQQTAVSQRRVEKSSQDFNAKMKDLMDAGFKQVPVE